MLTNAYEELANFLDTFGHKMEEISLACIGRCTIDVGGLLLRLNGTLYDKENHVGCLNPEMVLAGRRFWVSRGNDETWQYHIASFSSFCEMNDYHIWIGGAWGESEKGEKCRTQRIYVCGPYTSAARWNVERNIMIAIDTGIALFKKGHYPFIPHLSHYVDQRAEETGKHLTWDNYMERDLAWLKVSDALFFIGDSKGATIELEAAQSQGKKIYYAMSEVSDVSKGL